MSYIVTPQVLEESIEKNILYSSDGIAVKLSTGDYKLLTTYLNELKDTYSLVNHNHSISDIVNFPTSMPASDVYDWAKASTKPSYTASEVGADSEGSAATALEDAKSYCDTKISDLIGSGTPETLDTLKEISDAIQSSSEALEVLNNAIANKANQSDLVSLSTTVSENTSNIESLTSLVNLKASQTSVDSLSELVQLKADQTSVDEINTTISDHETRISSLEEYSVPTASSAVSGIMKLYNSLGSNTDGTINQKIITDELNSKLVAPASGEGILYFNTDKSVSIISSDKYALSSIYGSSYISLGRVADSDVGENSVAFGTTGMKATKAGAVAFGNQSVSEGLSSIALGYKNTSSGNYSFTGGSLNTANGESSVALGNNNTAGGANSFATNNESQALGDNSYAGGYRAVAANEYDWAYGLSSNITDGVAAVSLTSTSEIISLWNTSKFLLAKGIAAHAEGSNTLALGNSSHSEGQQTITTGNGSHAEGQQTKADGTGSHAEGVGTKATGTASHASGNGTIASGDFSTATGFATQATGLFSFTGGLNSIVSQQCSFAYGNNVTSSYANKAVFGIYNDDKSDTLFEVGIGTSSTDKKNAFEVVNDGTIRTLNGVFSKLSDNYSILDGNADEGVGASNFALYTAYTELLTKIESGGSGGQANVQSDWAETNTESDSYIKNKPTNLLYNSDSNLAVVDTTGDDTKNDVTTFTSEDSTTAESWTDVEVLSSGEKHSSLWKKVSIMFKNIRYLKNFLGIADISSIDDGTVTGAIKYINEKVFKSVSDGKILIADAITDKGVPTSADATFAIMANNIAQISASSGNIASGEFTTASTSQGIVNIDCGFRPDILLVFLPISSNTNGYTTAYYAKELSTTYSIWCLHPTENMTYTILLGSTSNGESGIQNITDTGFAFRCNASNTQNRKCTYIAYKSV